ncbi:MAG: HAMP domain-containing sensor histidine kinase [Candidatus Saccharimonas sp.]
MKHLKHDVLRLTGTYLIIIMTMSILFSAIFYSTAARELDRSPRPGGMGLNSYMLQNGDDIRDYLSQRADEGRASLLGQLIIINIMMLGVGALISYLLAERTLKPIEDNMEAQSQFVTDASHELRTPLTAIRTTNEVALRDKKLSIAQARQVIEENIFDITRLQELTDSMLGLLKDDDKMLFKQDIDLQRVVSDAMNAVVPQALEKHIKIEDSVADVSLQGSHQGLAQLVTILLDNAVKYSPKKSTIAVSSIQTAKQVTLTIQDRGMGMDRATIDQIFTRFYRADKARTQHGTKGYGLGLPIAKKIVDVHNGKIHVESTIGEGTTFRVELPRKQ